MEKNVMRFDDEVNRVDVISSEPENVSEGRPFTSAESRKFPLAKFLIGVGMLLILLVFLVLFFRSKVQKPSQEILEVGTYLLTQLKANDYYVNGTASLSGAKTNFGGDDNPPVKNMNFTSRLLAENHIQIKLTDNENERFEVPNEYPFPVLEPESPISWDSSRGQLDYPKDVGDSFTMGVRRKKTKEIIWNLKNRFIYSKYYIEFTTHLPNGYLYGLGERTGPLQLSDGVYTLWNKDTPFIFDNGTQGMQTYGYHPVYLIREESGQFSLVFLRISNAIDAIINSTNKTVTFKIAGGGILDIHVIIGGSSPEELISQYHTYIRKWNIPPFWGLGWHQCRWGYNNLNLLQDVLENYDKYKIPLDVIWTDIDYMYQYLDFSIDEQRYPVDKFKSLLNKYDKRWIPIIDAGVAIMNDSEITNKRLKELDVGIKYPDGKDYFVGSVWPGAVYYVDFWHPNADKYWSEMMEMLYQKIQFSGIWLDMNEFSNFCQGNCDKDKPKFPELPYNPGGPPLEEKTLDLGALHHGGYRELDVHVFGGYLESKATYDYLKTKTPLPFIISRSTAYGSGQFANHWTGDNVAKEEFLKYSIPTIMAFNLFGIPFTGSDICGFAGDASELLCARWHQVGAWYPFARNHHHIEGRYIEPYAYGENSTVLITALVALRYRYAHLRHYHTQFLLKNGTGTVFRPLFFEFPFDNDLFDAKKGFTERQFLIGDALMICPSFNAVEVDAYQAYFPTGSWYDYKTGALMTDAKNKGSVRKLESKLNDTTPVFIRGGKIVFAEFSSAQVVNSSDQLTNQFTMTIALNRSANSKSLYTAQGSIMGTKNVTDEYIWENCVLKSCIIQANVEGNNDIIQVAFDAPPGASITIDGIKVWGVEATHSQNLKGIASAKSTVQVTVETDGKTTDYTAQLGEHGDIVLEDVDILVDNTTVITFTLKSR